MRIFWELTKLSFQRQLAYRTAHLAGLVTNLFFGLLRAAVLLALYGAKQEVENLTVPMVITFTGISQALIGYLSLFSWSELMNTIYSGEITGDLLKPMSYFKYWMARDFGRASASFLMRSLTLMIAYAVIFDLAYPKSSLQWLALALSMLLSWFISFSWRFIVNLSAFWTTNARGIGGFLYGISWVLSGFIMPLAFFPAWFVTLARFTPFPSMIYTVIEVYLGVLSGDGLILALLTQALWGILLFVSGSLLLRAGVRRLVILGG
jgi:ABC-2 type transport system permease protein